VAVELAARAPGLVAGAVLIGPVVDPQRPGAVRQGLALARDCLGEPLGVDALLFADYVRHATARELWDALARTYDLDTTQEERRLTLRAFEFDLDAPLLEQIAHAEALATGLDFPWTDDHYLARSLCSKHPELLPARNRGGDIDMKDVWRIARIAEETRGLLAAMRTNSRPAVTARQK
jgi:pimeloyl-ACP methyl ester carboxylesterase